MEARATTGPRRITFVTNPDECNLACPMCREHSPLAPRPARPPRRLSFDVVERVLDERRGSALAEVVASTKGEPLLWPALRRLALACRTRGLSLNLTTNGTFPGGAIAWAQLLVPACSDVKISWNAVTAATAAAVMPGLALDRAVQGARAFLSVRDRLAAAGERACRVTFQVTAQERNVAELAGIVKLAAQLGVDRVKVNQLQVHFPALAPDDLRRDAAARGRWNDAVAAMREAARAHRAPGRPPLHLQNVQEWPDVGGGVPYGPCPFLDREAWVTADGDFAPCPAPPGQEGALGRFGSIHSQPLGAIWEGRPYRALVAGHASAGPCARCSLRRPGGV